MSLRVQVPWHHFARRAEGYATVAAAAQLSADTISRLERFGWGQPADAVYYRHIGDEPAFWIEPVGARVAITRVLEGTRDPAGRRTLAFHSLLPTIAEYEQLSRVGLAEPLRDQKLWEHRSPGPVVIEARSSAPPATEPSPFLRRLLQRFENRPSGGALVVAPGAVSLDLLLEALRRLPTDQLRRSRIAYLAASNALEADLVILAPGFSSEPAQIARQIWNGSSEAPTAEMGRVSIPTGSIPSRSSGVAWPPRAPHSNSQQLIGELRMDTKVSASFVGLAVLVVILGVANLMVTSNQVQSVHSALDTDIRSAKDEVHSAKDEIRKTNIFVQSTLGNINDFKQELFNTKTTAQEAEAQVRLLKTELEAVRSLGIEATNLLDGISKRLEGIEKDIAVLKAASSGPASPGGTSSQPAEPPKTDSKEGAQPKEGGAW